jgi:DNA-binding beta-propeller fold protein YncE
MTDETMIAVDKVGNKVRFYDADIKEMKVLDGPEPCVHELALAPDRKRAFIPLYGNGIYGNNPVPNNKVLVIDLARQEIADLIDLGEYVAPHGMAATRDGKLWVTCDIPNKLICLDPDTRKIEAVYDNPSKGGHIVELLADESKLYVSAEEGPLGAFDLKRRRFVATVPLAASGVTSGNGSGSEGVSSTKASDRVIACDNDTTALRVIDTGTDTEIERVPLQPFVFTNRKRSRMAKAGFSRDGKHLCAVSYASALAWVIDAGNLADQTMIAVAKGPMGLSFPPDGKSVLVTSHDSGLLTRIDLASRRAVAAYDGGVGIEVMGWY